MLSIPELKEISSARLRDSRVLFAARRYDGSHYLCGYAVEIALKARICKTLNWAGFPDKGKEFEGLGSFRTHDFEVLLRLSGYGPRVGTPK